MRKLIGWVWVLSVSLCEKWNLLSWIIYPSPLSSVGQISALGGRSATESGGPNGEHLTDQSEARDGASWPIRGRHRPRSLGDQEAVIRLLLVLRRKQLVMDDNNDGKHFFEKRVLQIM